MENEEQKPASPRLLHEQLTKSVIGGFYTVYNALGAGFLEAVYAGAMGVELRKRGHKVEREIRVRVYYDGIVVAWYKVDMLVDDVLVVENKSGARLDPTGVPQLENCLRATDLELGLLLHFGTRPRFHRLICTHSRRGRSAPLPPDPPHPRQSESETLRIE